MNPCGVNETGPSIVNGTAMAFFALPVIFTFPLSQLTWMSSRFLPASFSLSSLLRDWLLRKAVPLRMVTTFSSWSVGLPGACPSAMLVWNERTWMGAPEPLNSVPDLIKRCVGFFLSGAALSAPRSDDASASTASETRVARMHWFDAAARRQAERLLDIPWEKQGPEPRQQP